MKNKIFKLNKLKESFIKIKKYIPNMKHKVKTLIKQLYKTYAKLKHY